ncbi:MAG: hypothetical protein ACJ77E_07375 [Gaiellaceae bacterium]
MHRLAPTLVLVSVTTLLLVYGGHPWSWVGGPVASLFLWVLDRSTGEPSPAAPAPPAVRVEPEPAPVD